MKAVIVSIVFSLVFISCNNAHIKEIEDGIKVNEANKGHSVISYEIVRQGDSTKDWYVVDYTAVVDSNRTSGGHLIWGKTMDNMLTR